MRDKGRVRETSKEGKLASTGNRDKIHQVIIEGSPGCLIKTTIHFRSYSIKLAVNLETTKKKKKSSGLGGGMAAVFLLPVFCCSVSLAIIKGLTNDLEDPGT